MKISRRQFFGVSGALASSTLLPGPRPLHAWEPKGPRDAFGCVVDLTRCIGCRKCEQGCNLVQRLPEPDRPFEDPLVLNRRRHMDAKSYTVVNRFHTGRVDEKGEPVATFVKLQCMHCLEPACVSACPVGALKKKENGAVYYDESLCIGCRYCMIACPFQVPCYEYDDPLTPRVRKCTFCFDERLSKGQVPGCVDICPVEAITFGKRDVILEMARQRIKDDPGRYIHHIYGEKEAGGTSWLYLSGAPFNKLGFQTLPETPMPKLPETLQHAFYSYLWAPLVLFGALGGIMGLSNRGVKSKNAIAERSPRHE